MSLMFAISVVGTLVGLLILDTRIVRLERRLSELERWTRNYGKAEE